jgi:hypothetical protein
MPVTYPAGFTKCKTGQCPEVDFVPDGTRPRKVIIGSPKVALATPCNKTATCQCFILRGKEEGNPKAVQKWEVPPVEEDGTIRESQRYTYEVHCLTPAFQDPAITLINCGDCEAPVPGPDKSKPKTRRCKVSDACLAAGGRCRLFKLKAEDEDAQWEEMDKDDDIAKNHYYRCFCVK